MWRSDDELSSEARLAIGAIVLAYVAGLAVLYSIGDGSPMSVVAGLGLVGAWSFLLGLAVGRVEALAGPALATIVLMVAQAAFANDYSWTDTGPIVLVIFLAYAGVLFLAMGMCVSAGAGVAHVVREAKHRDAGDGR